MPLRPVVDLSPADWVVADPADEWTRILMGPPGFEAYARVRFHLDGDADDYVDDTEIAGRVLQALTRHTTSSQAFFGFWEGSGFLDGHSAEPLMTGSATFHLPARVSSRATNIPWRSYHLLTGGLQDLDAWSSAPALHLVWPADHAWFYAADVDPDWIGVGGTTALVDEILAHPGLDAVAVTYDATEWESR